MKCRILFAFAAIACTSRAAIVTITITGTVSSGTDGNPASRPPGAGNVFGVGDNLAGEPFFLTLNVSDAEGTYTPGKCSDGSIYTSALKGSSTSIAPTATLQIGNGIFTYGNYPLQNIGWITGRTAHESCYGYNSISFGWSEDYTGGYAGTSGFGSAVLYSLTNFSTGDLHSPILLANVSAAVPFHFSIEVADSKTLANLKYAFGYLIPQTISVSGTAGTTACPSANVNPSAGVYPGGAENMLASFMAPSSETIGSYARGCGFDYLEWQSKMTYRPAPAPTSISFLTGANPQPLHPKPLIASGNVVQFGNIVSLSGGNCISSWIGIGCSLIAPPAFFDPPQGSYADFPYNPYPFFIPSVNVVANANSTTLFFGDAPGASFLSGEPPTKNPSGPFEAFETTLVGVSHNQGPPSCGPNISLYCTPLYSWTWNTTYDGTTGGVTVTSINGVPQH